MKTRVYNISYKYKIIRRNTPFNTIIYAADMWEKDGYVYAINHDYNYTHYMRKDDVISIEEKV